MGENHSSSLAAEIQDVAKVQYGREILPKKLGDTILPVINVNPKHARRCNIVRGSTRTSTRVTTIYTTPVDKDFYLTGIIFSNVSDAAADNTVIRLSITMESQVRYLVELSKITLTAFNGIISIPFTTPIKIDRNTAITAGCTFTVGVSTTSCTIIGYTVELEGQP